MLTKVAKEEVIFKGHDTGWGRELPVRLLTYPDGKMDLHRQTGNQFEEHIAAANEILALRGLVAGNQPEFIGPTGAYLAVNPIEKAAA